MLVAGVVTAAIALGAASAPSALAASGWTPPINFPLPANATAQTARVAYDSTGTATVAYLELVSQSPLQTVLHAGIIRPGGSYQEQLRIPSTSTAVPVGLALAEAPTGAAVLEWTALQSPSPGAALTYLASYRTAASSSWDTPATIATDTTTEPGIGAHLVPAISADGTAAAGVDHVDPSIPSPGGYRIDVSVHPPGAAHVYPPSAGWGAAQQISPASDSSENLGLGFDSSGDLTAAFRVRMPGGRYTLESVTRPGSNGIWSTLRDITGSDPTSDVEVPKLGVAPDGSAVIAFQYVHYAAPSTLDVNAVTRSGQNGSWSAPVDAAPGGSSSSPLAAGVALNTNAFILYSFEGSNSGLNCVGVVRAPILQNPAPPTFTPPQCVSPTNFQNGTGGLALLGSDAYFAWTGQPNGGSPFVAEGSRWDGYTAQPDTAIDLESPASALTFTSIADEGDGTAVAFWVANKVLRAAAFQPVGPLAFLSVRQSRRTWRVSKERVTRRYRAIHVATTFEFGLNMAATVTLTFDRIVSGRRVSGVCRRRTNRNRHRRSCSRPVPVGSITTLGLLGSNSIGFTGHLGRRRLRPGKYTVTLTALNSWGQRASHKLRFRIRR
jgi:hypothetical protein